MHKGLGHPNSDVTTNPPRKPRVGKTRAMLERAGVDGPPECKTGHASISMIRPGQIVYGTPGYLPPKFRCEDCTVEWEEL